jgi:hypothetical protein
MEVRPAGAELFNADVWTDVTKPIVAFRSPANAPQNVLLKADVLNNFDDVTYCT